MLSRSFPFVLKLSPAEIGQRIAAKRRERGLSQQSVGKACGLSQNSVRKIEQGQVEVSRFVPAIWQHLGLDMSHLTGDAGLLRTPQHHDLSLSAGDVEVITQAFLVENTTLQWVNVPSLGGKRMMITWQLKNGARVSGLFDHQMVVKAARRALEIVGDDDPPQDQGSDKP